MRKRYSAFDWYLRLKGHQIFNGLLVTKVDLRERGTQHLCSSPYFYSIYPVQMGDSCDFEKLESYTVLIQEPSPDFSLEVSGQPAPMTLPHIIQVEKTRINLKILAGHATLLVAGTPHSPAREQSVHCLAATEVKKVVKPWGHELWLNHRAAGDPALHTHPHYAFKEIFIKQGNKTSLQYHHLKRETIVLFQGRARLHHGPNPESIQTTELNAMVSIDVKPMTIHRIEALTDITLLEASTPLLDDVVRLADDTHRPHGRIASEHT